MTTPEFRGYPLGGTPYDMATAFAAHGQFSTVAKQDMALSVPLGSQLNLLNAYNAGNPYLNFARTNNQKLGSLAHVLVGYNTMGQNNANGSYATFGSAYSM